MTEVLFLIIHKASFVSLRHHKQPHGHNVSALISITLPQFPQQGDEGSLRKSVKHEQKDSHKHQFAHAAGEILLFC